MHRQGLPGAAATSQPGAGLKALINATIAHHSKKNNGQHKEEDGPQKSPLFDLSLPHGPLDLSPSADGSLAWFLFTLLKRLQDLGTCPAVDWLSYREVLSHQPSQSAMASPGSP